MEYAYFSDTTLRAGQGLLRSKEQPASEKVLEETTVDGVSATQYETFRWCSGSKSVSAPGVGMGQLETKAECEFALRLDEYQEKGVSSITALTLQ